MFIYIAISLFQQYNFNEIVDYAGWYNPEGGNW